MSGVTTNLPVQWLPAPAAVTFDITVTVGDPSPGAAVCYDATGPAGRCQP